MLSLFKKRKISVNNNTAQEKIAAVIVQRVINIQRHWAAWMQRKTDRFSLRTKKYSVLVFSGMLCSYSGYVIVRSLAGRTEKIMTVDVIPVSTHATQTADTKSPVGDIISEKEMQRIIGFRHYMDSLGTSVSGKRIADSILQIRPGLMDSIAQLEKIYELQK